MNLGIWVDLEASVARRGRAYQNKKYFMHPCVFPPHPTLSKQNAKYNALLIRFDPEVKGGSEYFNEEMYEFRKFTLMVSVVVKVP